MKLAVVPAYKFDVFRNSPVDHFLHASVPYHSSITLSPSGMVALLGGIGYMATEHNVAIGRPPRGGKVVSRPFGPTFSPYRPYMAR